MCTRHVVSTQNKNIVLELMSTIFRIIVEILKAITRCIFPMRRKLIHNDIVLITGGGKGIGRLLAVRISEYRPKHIILWGRTEHHLKATSQAIRLKGIPCSYMVCDVSDWNQVCRKAEEVKTSVGNVTLLINNAGVVHGNTILNSSPEDIQDTLGINTMGQIWTVKAFLPHMIAMQYGHIVSINSVLGLMGLNGAADYSASKFALTGFMESLQMELAASNMNEIKLTNIHPYIINTQMFAGCETRFPWLFQSLDKEYAADRITQAVLTNETMVIMPRIMNVFYIIKQLIPTEAFIAAQHFAGVHKTMQKFRQQKKKENSQK